MNAPTDTQFLMLGPESRRQVNGIGGRLSLRKPQKQALEILARVCEIVPPHKRAQTGTTPLETALHAIRSEFKGLASFERDFPSLCFELATGVGKTRLMGAFITYLHRVHGLRDFFVLAPNLTIYQKLIADFTPNTAKYVFQGVADFATSPPQVITGDNYESIRSLRPPTRGAQPVLPGIEANVRINIFNISKLFSTTKDDKAQGREARIKRLNETLGQSYFDYLAGLEDLVVIMDESHRYRADASARAITELKPVLGLELTATPQTESGARGASRFQNVIYSYRLGNAIADGYVKRPAVATRANFQADEYDADRIDLIKLSDGVALHELTKVELTTYASRTGRAPVKPFVLVIAADTTKAATYKGIIESDDFYGGRYKGKVIEVHSGQRGAESDENVAKLLTVERFDNDVEIVIHVNMLKEGWDVTNLYTIIPLRAAHSQTLVEQSIGRGLRLPYGERVGVAPVDTVTIVAHDHFHKIVEDANRPGSVLRQMGTIVIDDTVPLAGQKIVTAEPTAKQQVLDTLAPVAPGTTPTPEAQAKRDVHQATLTRLPQAIAQGEVQITHVGNETQVVVSPRFEAAVRAELAVREDQPALTEVEVRQELVRAAEAFVERVIEIPRITVTPRGEVTVGFHDFDLDFSAVRLQPIEDDIVVRSLVDDYQQRVRRDGRDADQRAENMVIGALMNYDDVDYGTHAALLQKLATQAVEHLRSYLPDEDAVRNVLLYHEHVVAEHIHTALLAHQWQKADDYEVRVVPGTVMLRPLALNALGTEADRDFRSPVDEKGEIRLMVFGGFKKCLYDRQKFDSDTERLLACLLEDDPDVEKWIKPARGQFVIDYAQGAEYEPDFVVETRTMRYIIEPKAANQMSDPTVLAKKRAADTWCDHATTYARTHGGKPWKYLLVPHGEIKVPMTVAGLAARRG